MPAYSGERADASIAEAVLQAGFSPVGTYNGAERYKNWATDKRMSGSMEEHKPMDQPKKASSRGFASMDPEKQRAIARKGGESVPHEKRSFSQNPRLAAEAGRKGGQSVNPVKRSFSQNHALASEAGRKGGHASHGGPRKIVKQG